MDTDLKIILEFLGRCGTEVEGRTAVQPDPEDAALLFRFASGESDPAERRTVCAMIQEHPEWLGWVSHRIKARRADPPPRASRNGAHWDS